MLGFGLLRELHADLHDLVEAARQSNAQLDVLVVKAIEATEHSSRIDAQLAALLRCISTVQIAPEEADRGA